jgi:hypothetical protein
MRPAGFCVIFILILACESQGWDMRVIPLADSEVSRLGEYSASCVLDYYYLVDGCAYVTVIDGLSEDQSIGLHFNMTDSVAWYPPCDTAACLTLDAVELVLYDVLAAPSNQSMNVSVYEADASGEPVGQMLGNRSFNPIPTGTIPFTTSVIDFTAVSSRGLIFPAAAVSSW